MAKKLEKVEHIQERDEIDKYEHLYTIWTRLKCHTWGPSKRAHLTKVLNICFLGGLSIEKISEFFPVLLDVAN